MSEFIDSVFGRDVPAEVETLELDQIEIKSHIGGLVKSFERKAA